MGLMDRLRNVQAEAEAESGNVTPANTVKIIEANVELNQEVDQAQEEAKKEKSLRDKADEAKDFLDSLKKDNQ